MSEQVRVVGNLVGIQSGDGPDRPTVLFWNAGLLHRVGPYRNFVTLARALAADGFTTFRFDLGGLGDSPAHRDARSDEQRALDDVRAVMDGLGHERYILVGLCSGAYQSHYIARDDERVVGCVFLDGFAWPTFGWRWRHWLTYYGRRMLRLGAWKRFLFTRRAAGGGGAGEWTTAPDREEARADLARITGRGARLLFVYTGGYVYYNYAGQFRDAMGDLGNVDVEYIEKANHTVSLMTDRAELNGTILDWIRSTTPSR